MAFSSSKDQSESPTILKRQIDLTTKLAAKYKILAVENRNKLKSKIQ